jgi:acyl-CoA dehydrogenase
MVTFLTDERRALQDATRAFVEREVAPYLQDWEDTGEIPRSLHQAAAKGGLLALGFPEEVGGDGGDLADATAMQEAFFAAGASSGRAAAPSPTD